MSCSGRGTVTLLASPLNSVFDGHVAKSTEAMTGVTIMPRWRLAVLCATLVALSASFWWATAVWAVLPFGSLAFYPWTLFGIAAFLLALCGLPASLLAAVSRRARRKALGVSAVCAAILLGSG